MLYSNTLNNFNQMHSIQSDDGTQVQPTPRQEQRKSLKKGSRLNARPKYVSGTIMTPLKVK